MQISRPKHLLLDNEAPKVRMPRWNYLVAAYCTILYLYSFTCTVLYLIEKQKLQCWCQCWPQSIHNSTIMKWRSCSYNCVAPEDHCTVLIVARLASGCSYVIRSPAVLTTWNSAGRPSAITSTALEHYWASLLELPLYDNHFFALAELPLVQICPTSC